mmetsp:Transcript_12406/g.23250  ORF Transcript_12406/g.23250 Transcript_12406/m.23250 type:complete len:211 (+) Transcript_12406:67-699(+)
MGPCCSCFKTKPSTRETELTEKSTPETNPFSFSVSRQMSAPTVKINGLTVTGHGIALVNVSIEQDASYWEWHIATDDNVALDDDDGHSILKFGVATRKNREFFEALGDMEDNDDEMSVDDGTKLMRAIPNVKSGDTIGVAVQQSDLPMVQFLHNGEPIHELAISRFRGMVFPSIYMRDGYSATFVWNEDEFKEMSPHVRFGPLIPERGLI